MRKAFIKELSIIYIVIFLWGFYFPKTVESLIFVSKGLSYAEIGLSVTLLMITQIIFEYPSGMIAVSMGEKMLCLYHCFL